MKNTLRQKIQTEMMFKGKRRRVVCVWCSEKYWSNHYHKCPPIFIHKLTDKEITIRADNLDLEWLGKNILVRDRKRAGDKFK